ncbi:MAG: AMP-binding protein, partial [Lachnospiraceae bacterium]|nr:AMP-binding protein [Lachnospiraceae bacterium]
MSMVITDFLEEAVRKWPDKTVYTDPARQISFAALRREALQIAHALIGTGALRQPIAVYMEKGISCMSAMLGTAYSGNFYTVLDLQMPAARIDRILSVLQPRVLLTDAAHAAAAKELLPEGAVLLTLEDALAAAVDEEAVLMIGMFFLGALILTPLCTLLQERAIWFAMVPLIVSFALMLNADLVVER